MIYEFITERGKLSDDHIIELKTKRGFTDETIKKNRFFSGGKYLLEIEAELIKSFTSDALLASGVCLKKETLHLAPQLLEDRVIIPYLDASGKAVLIRPHKLGLKNIGVRVYHDFNFDKEDIMITEGEFKAAAGCQLGFPTIALPGVGSFSDKHFKELVSLLNDRGVKHVVICFDNEVKDDPQYKDKYKPSPLDRWDTQYYTFLMAKMLEAQGFYCRIAVLPDSWMDRGKIDIDGAVAAGKTEDDFRRIINTAKTHKEYHEELPKEAKDVIRKKLNKKYFKSHVVKEFGRYIARRQRGKTQWEEIISNFTLKIMATHDTSDGIVREIIMINEIGECSKAFSLAADSMSGADSFATFCLGRGNFIWRGNRDDLCTIWESEFLDDDGRLIIEPDHIGWIPSEKMWLFGNIALDKNGKELRADDNHIFWTDKKGIKPVSIAVSSGRSYIAEGMPYLNLNPINMKEVAGKFSDTIGKMYACMCLGWITAVLFQEEVFKDYGCFPFLFITGRKGSGKSHIAEWLMNFYGLENCGKQAEDTTPVGLQRYLGYYSSMPVFMDEYRNTKQITYKNGMLRNVYNRQSSGKGIKANFGVREAKIRGTMIISGEETPADNALLTRCITVLVSEKKRTTNHFNWFMANKLKFSYHVLAILREKPNLVKKFMHELNAGKEYLVKSGSDDRTAINYAIIAAGYAVGFGGSVDFAKWISVEAKRAKDDYQSEHAAETFMEDLVYIKTKKMINSEFFSLDGDRIYLYFHGLYMVFSENYRKVRGSEPFKESAIRDYLKDYSGFLDSNYAHRLGGSIKKCMVFDYELAPAPLQALVDNFVTT